jgi:hypothetical protein
VRYILPLSMSYFDTCVGKTIILFYETYSPSRQVDRIGPEYKTCVAFWVLCGKEIPSSAVYPAGPVECRSLTC